MTPSLAADDQPEHRRSARGLALKLHAVTAARPAHLKEHAMGKRKRGKGVPKPGGTKDKRFKGRGRKPGPKPKKG